MPAPPAPGARQIRCDADGTRLDRLVAERGGGMTRRRTAAIIAAGAVRVNGRRARKGQLLRRGDVVEIDAAALATAPLAAQPELALPLLYQDEALIALDKPPGMPAMALRSDDRDTAANFLVAIAPESAVAGGSPLEAGLVHRLDTGTSGVLLAARTAVAWRDLRGQFHRGQVEKHYLAWVDGDVARAATRREPIAHDPRRPRSMRVCFDPQQARALAGRPALTHFRPLARRGDMTLLAVEITTGVRHQIRVHLAAIGHPIRGDALYGGSPAPRLMLHAATLVVRHPTSGGRLRIESPPPTSFAAPA
ncbi:RluA family pseudouridine synthase [bacterium]|nr:RluA family pseudouridine synthase [bacterium]